MLLGIIIIALILLVLVGIALYLVFRDDEAVVQRDLTTALEKVETGLHQRHAPFSSSLFKTSFLKIVIVQEDFLSLKQALHKHIVGMDYVIHAVILCVLCNGHLLLEWAPGLAKTKTISLFAQLIGLDFARVQFTPDMLPSDIVGIEMYNQHTGKFSTQLWPIVANVILADEINRTTPKVQSALLEAMQEKQITIAGVSHALPQPFLVLATQNPIEQEGTYPLPEAQLDRFMCKVMVDYPTEQQEKQILSILEQEPKAKTITPIIWWKKKLTDYQKRVQSVIVSDAMKDYITELVALTRKPHPQIRYGASPRASIALMQLAKAIAFLEWRDHVIENDIQRAYLPVMRHRIILSYDAQVTGVSADDFLIQLMYS